MHVIPNSTTVHVYRWLIKPFMIMLLESLLGKTHRIIIILVTIQVPNAHFMMEVPHPKHCSDSLAYIVQVSWAMFFSTGHEQFFFGIRRSWAIFCYSRLDTVRTSRISPEYFTRYVAHKLHSLFYTYSIRIFVQRQTGSNVACQLRHSQKRWANHPVFQLKD